MISIIVHNCNEEQKIEQLLDTLHQLAHTCGKEIIISVEGSSDNTIEAINNRARIIINGKTRKSFKLNKAAQAAWGDILLFVHTDMHLPPNILLVIEEVIYQEKFDGGGFTNKLEQNNNGKIKQIGSIRNTKFFDKKNPSDKGIFYCDNAIFIKKSAFQQLEGFKEIPFMEDYDFSKRASQQFNLKKITNPVIKISIQKRTQIGFLMTQFLWLVTHFFYKLGIFPSILAK